MKNNNKMESLLALFANYAIGKNYCISMKNRRKLITRLRSDRWGCATQFEINVKHILDPILPILIGSKGDLKFCDENEKKTILHHFLTKYVKEVDCVTNDESERDSKVVEHLIKKGSSVLTYDRKGNTALGIVIAKKRLDLIQVMQRCISNANDTNQGDETFLHILINNYAEYSHDRQNYLNNIIQIIRNLISDGAHINKAQYVGMTAAHLAAKHCHLEMLQLLKKNGADLNVQTYEKNDVLIFLCKHIWELKDSSMLIKTINWLLEQDCDVNLKNIRGLSALHYASQSANLDVIETLVQAGAAPNSTDSDSTSPLYLAALFGSVEAMQYLIELTVNARHCRDSAYGFTLPHLVAYNGNKRKFDLVVEKDYYLNSPAEGGVTPLHLACLRGNAEIAEELLARGAKVDCREKTCRYAPLHLASMAGNLKNLNTEILDAITFIKLRNICGKSFSYESNYNGTICALLKAGANANVKDKFGWTPLNYALSQYEDDVISQLVNAGAHVDTQDANGLLPLDHAIESKNCFGFLCLIDFGADINDVKSARRGRFLQIKLNNSMFADKLLYHAVKLKAAGLPIDDVYKSHLDTPQLQNFDANCLKEIEKLKLHMLRTNVSVYNLLHLSCGKRWAFEDGLSCGIRKEFPIYQSVIQASILQARQRRLLLNQADSVFKQITKIEWPYLCTERIFSYLSNRYLRVFVECAQNF